MLDGETGGPDGSGQLVRGAGQARAVPYLGHRSVGADDGQRAVLRGARLDEALARRHIEFLREVALKDEDTARLWWLHCNLSGETPDTSWTAFKDIVRPLIRIADENDPVTRLARALLTMNDYFHADPERLNYLADLTAFAAKKVGDDEIASTLAMLRQPSRASQSGTNGAIPASP